MVFKDDPSWLPDTSLRKLGQTILLRVGDTVYTMSDLMGMNRSLQPVSYALCFAFVFLFNYHRLEIVPRNSNARYVM